MSTNTAYKITASVQQAAGQPLNQSQLASLSSVESYLQKHKIHEICNELVAKLLQSKPEKPKQQMINILKKMKEKSFYFKKSDFEAMFESFDAFGGKGTNQIPYAYLIQALTHINVKYTQQQFLLKYPQFKLQKGIKKSQFLSIMQAEYNKKNSF